MDDTHPRARKVQIGLLRTVTPTERFDIARDLTTTTISLSRRAVQRTMPDAEEADVLLRWIEVTYGRQVANRVRPHRARLGS